MRNRSAKRIAPVPVRCIRCEVSCVAWVARERGVRARHMREITGSRLVFFRCCTVLYLLLAGKQDQSRIDVSAQPARQAARASCLELLCSRPALSLLHCCLHLASVSHDCAGLLVRVSTSHCSARLIQAAKPESSCLTHFSLFLYIASPTTISSANQIDLRLSLPPAANSVDCDRRRAPADQVHGVFFSI
jgi:hypothetical protein